MKTFIFSILGFLITVSSWASPVQCEVKSNLTLVMKVEVQTLNSEKVLVGEYNSIRAYITEKSEDLFTVEAFLPDYEMRIYAEGDLKSNSHKLTASYWGRDSMLDVSCQRIVK